MFECKDQLGRNVVLTNFPPTRIISLVPSQTELLYDLGLNDEVIGITKFCVHPEHWFRTKERVGGTKNVNIEKVRSLNPDIIIANKEENVKEQIEQLKQIAPVWISDVTTIDDALQMMQSVGEITKRLKEAETLITQIATNFSNIPASNIQLPTAYLIWRNPYMTVGGDSFISNMLHKCGLHNVFEKETRYPEISIEETISRKPLLILLSSEPYPFKQKHVEELQPFFANTKILLVDGEMFSWYGSRMMYAANYFADLKQIIKH